VVERGCCGLIAIGLGSIWVGGDFGLDRIAVSSGAVQTDITLPFHASSLAVGANGVWVADVRTDRLWLINPKTNTLEASVPVGEHPSAVAVGEGSVWVASAAGTVSRIDPDTARVISTISVGGTPSGIAVGLGTVWVTVD
jgi:YVTN family beta-propeller protein